MKRSLVNGTSSVLGGIHFVSSFIAEQSLIAEAKLKRDHLGITVEETCSARIAITNARIDRVYNAFKSKEHVQATLVLTEAQAS